MKKFLIAYFTVFILGLGVYGYFSYQKIESIVNEMYEPIDDEDVKEKPLLAQEENKEEAKKPLTFLLLGIDQRGNERGRSDAIIVAVVNPQTNKMTMVSIPRDTRTLLVGKGKQDKINHAYAFGGVKMTADTVENFLDIPIDYYVTVNMKGFKETVDLVGGVTVNNTMAFNFYDDEFSFKNFDFPKGEITLNGEEALMYARMRKQDPRGDFGRNDRQKQIISAIIDKAKSPSMITKLDDTLGIVGDNIRTNLTFDEMKILQKHYGSVNQNTETLQLNGTGQMIGGGYYYVVSEEEKTKISNTLKAQLNTKAE